MARTGRQAPRVARQYNKEHIIQATITSNHSAVVRETEDHFKKQKTVNDHCNRLKEMIRWVHDNYREYYEQGVIELTEEQKADQKRYYKSTHDFVYNAINVDITKAFLGTKKYHPNKQTRSGKRVHYSFSHLRKFYDAILFGAYRAKSALPERYEIEMKTYLDSIKKEKTVAKKKGETEQREADPITFELYRLLCKIAIDAGNMFAWAFTVAQWSCMARSISIDDLTFGQISVASDSLVIEYCDSKSDQTGDKTTPKNCYANPYDYHVCIFTALGCYFCMNNETYMSERDTIFRNREAEPGTASHRYCNTIQRFYKRNKQKIDEYIRANHFHPHGTRKGAAIRASSGTTLPASLAAIANRGEWTVSMMFDVYLGFAEPGDQYLGRLLAGLDPNKGSFSCIPPHFTEGMENDDIKEAMELCFKGIMDKVDGDIVDIDDNGEINEDNAREDFGLRSNTKAMLLRCLGCMVHHSDELLKVISENNRAHPFASIPILTRPNLLHNLKQIITMKPSERIQLATGVPPHVEAAKKLDELVDLVELERSERKQHFEEIKQVVGDKLEEIAIENGNLTRPAVEVLFEQFGRQFETHITKKIDDVVRNVVQPPVVQQSQVPVVTEGINPNDPRDSGQFPLYYYDGQYWQVPFEFKLPTKMKRKQAWEMWLCGMTTPDLQVICPFRLFKMRMLPKQIKNKFKVQWQPILRKMMAGIQHIQLPAEASQIDSRHIDTTFHIATNHLKENICSFLWEKDNSIIENWNIATWSSNTQRAYIMKHGNQKDIDNLPAPTRWNNPHKTKRTLKRRNPYIYDHTQQEAV